MAAEQEVQESLWWLRSRNDPPVTRIQPVPGRERLLVSFTIPSGDPLAFLAGRSWTYDNAVGAIALLLHGRIRKARQVLTNLRSLMALDGSLGFSYQVNSDFMDARVRTGTMAWVGVAFLLYQRVTGDSRFLSAAVQIGELLRTLQISSGSLRGGPDVAWISTEHNVDGYFFFRELYRLTGQESYRGIADQIKASLLVNHWVEGPVPHFLQGIGDDTPSLDANALGAIFLNAIGRPTLARQALTYVEALFKNQQAITGSTVTFVGYSPDAARKTIWLEGTATTALAYWGLGEEAKARRIVSHLYRVRTVWIQQGKWNGGFPYAMPRYLNPDGDTFAEWESVASTSWFLIALALREGDTRFLGRD